MSIIRPLKQFAQLANDHAHACRHLLSGERVVDVETAPVIAGPSMADAMVTTKDGQRFPEMPALPPLVSSFLSFL